MSLHSKSSSSILFLGKRQTAVHEGLLGTAFARTNLVLLENHNFLFRRDHKSMIGKVKIIAGGGAGLQETGFIGKGMLTGVILGDIFVAPPAKSILTAIRELAHEHQDGILLIVKNYLGDFLNFSLAYERALSENLSVKMLLIGDDSTNSYTGKYGRRGSAGCVLLYKIAGAMAESGKSLDDIFKMCRKRVLTDLTTTNVCLKPSNYLKWMVHDFNTENEAMFGIGLYGQSGIKKKFDDMDHCINIMLDYVVPITSGSMLVMDHVPVVVLLNNLGALSGLEENIIGFNIVKQLEKRNFDVVRFYSGTFLPLLDSKGFSITILKLCAQESLIFLDAPTTAYNWPKSPYTSTVENQSLLRTSGTGFSCTIVSPTINHEKLDNQTYEEKIPQIFESVYTESRKNVIKDTIYFAAEALISCEKQINIIDMEVGDGDAGTMLKIAASAIKEALERNEIRLHHPYIFLHELGDIIERTTGGITGALYSMFFDSASKEFSKSDDLGLRTWCEAFKSGVKAIRTHGKAEPGERTILDVLIPATEVFELAVRKNDHIHRIASNIACICEYHTGETKKIKPVYFRGSQPKPGTLLYPDAAFEQDHKAVSPGIFLWKFITKKDAEFILNDETPRAELLEFLREKSKGDDAQQMLLYDIKLYCKKNYSNHPGKLSVMMGILHYAHLYFKASRWRTPSETYNYFKESILRHAMEYPPTNMEVLTPEEAREALLFFVDIYMRNLPLIRLLCLPHYKLRLHNRRNVDLFL